MLYLIYDAPWMVCLYAYRRNDPTHVLMGDLALDRLVHRVFYQTPLAEKIRLLDAPDTDPETLLWLFESGRTYPSQAMVDAIRRNQHRTFGDRDAAFVADALTRMEEMIAITGDVFPDIEPR